MGLSVRTLAIMAKANPSGAEASSDGSSPRASMPCRSSTALLTTSGLILEFFLRALCGEDRPFKMGGLTLAPGLVPASISCWRFQEDYGVGALVG